MKVISVFDGVYMVIEGNVGCLVAPKKTIYCEYLEFKNGKSPFSSDKVAIFWLYDYKRYEEIEEMFFKKAKKICDNYGVSRLIFETNGGTTLYRERYNCEYIESVKNEDLEEFVLVNKAIFELPSQDSGYMFNKNRELLPW